MIAKKTVIQDIKLADFPEEIDEQNNIKSVRRDQLGKSIGCTQPLSA